LTSSLVYTDRSRNMASPAIALPFVRIRIDHPPFPALGQPCRAGTAVGVRAYDPFYEEVKRDRARGTFHSGPVDPQTLRQMYPAEEVPVSFHHTAWRVPVRNLAPNTALPGEIVHYIDDLTDNADAGHGTNCAVKPSGTEFNGNAIVGLLLEPVKAEDTAEVYVLLQFARRDWHWLSCPAAKRLPNTRNGEWVFRGTRVPLSTLFKRLQEGGNIEDFIDDHDAVSREQVTQVLQHTALDLDKYADPNQHTTFPTSEAAPRT